MTTIYPEILPDIKVYVGKISKPPSVLFLDGSNETPKKMLEESNGKT